MDDAFKAGKFVLKFAGDRPIARLCDGLDAVGAKIREEPAISADEYEECFGGLADEDERTVDDHGPFSFACRWGDMCYVEICRIHTPE